MQNFPATLVCPTLSTADVWSPAFATVAGAGDYASLTINGSQFFEGISEPDFPQHLFAKKPADFGTSLFAETHGLLPGTSIGRTPSEGVSRNLFSMARKDGGNEGRGGGLIPAGKQGNLGQILFRQGVIDAGQLAKMSSSVARGQADIDVLKALGVPEDDIATALAAEYGLSVLVQGLDKVQITDAMMDRVPKNVARKFRIVPVEVNEAARSMVIAIADPLQTMDALAAINFFAKGFKVETAVAPGSFVDRALDTFYGETTAEDALKAFSESDLKILLSPEGAVSEDELRREAGEAPITRLVNLIIVDAIKKRASDIHIQPHGKGFIVRYRIDGLLHQVSELKFNRETGKKVVNRLKIMAELDIAERALPQDGGFHLVLGDEKDNREFDFRVSTIPALDLEKVVIRIQAAKSPLIGLDQLGFEGFQQRMFEEAIDEPDGLILVTGPTGSGKTTTLYAALHRLNIPAEAVLTIEDPVERVVPGLTQVRINDAKGVNYAKASRAILRQDPDTVMVGEIRDFETAEAAVKMGQTGHLVLSTLHTNSATATIDRLLRMGVETQDIAEQLILILAQRLIMRICENCRRPQEDVSTDILIAEGVPESMAAGAKIFCGTGCKECDYTGYRGRIAVYEMLSLVDDIQEAISEGTKGVQLRNLAIKLGMQDLRMSAIIKMLQGVTTLKEVTRMTRGKRRSMRDRT